MEEYIANNSEVASLRRRIELECEAMNQALNGYAAVTRHEIIAHQHHMLNHYHQQLEQIVGKQNALEISVNIYDLMIKQENV